MVCDKRRFEMREIKLRAWDKDNNCMIYNWYKVVVEDFTKNRFIGRQKQTLATEVMQFTGLKDKNGKEIYEGDIVRYKYCNETSLSEAHYFKYIVEWNELNNKWCFVQPHKPDGNVLDEFYTGGQDGQNLNKYFRIEVIGNIYENPELLKEAKE